MYESPTIRTERPTIFVRLLSSMLELTVMANLVLRPAAGGEAATIVKLVNGAYGSYAPLTGTPIGFGRTTVAEVERYLRKAHSTILLAVGPDDTGTIRACVHCAMSPGKVATLGLLAVAKTHQCRGVARELVQQAREYVTREWGATSLRAFVVMRQAALVAWYERLGFVRQSDTWRMPEEHRQKLFRPEDDAELFVYEQELCAC